MLNESLRKKYGYYDGRFGLCPTPYNEKRNISYLGLADV